MQPDRTLLAAQWRATAAEDLRVAVLLADESPSAAAFHAQQAADKALKAACVIAIDDAPRTHVISHLLDELARNGESIGAEKFGAAGVLDRYYAPTRYPDALGGIDPNRIFTVGDARGAVERAQQVLAFAADIVERRPDASPEEGLNGVATQIGFADAYLESDCRCSRHPVPNLHRHNAASTATALPRMRHGRRPMNTITVGMLAFPKMQLLDFIGPYEFFTAAPHLDATIIGPSAQPFEVGAGMSITPHYGAADGPAVDVLFVPGGTGVNDLLGNDLILDYLTTAGQRAQFVTSVCTGSLVLGAAGLLRGYRAVTHWRYIDLLPLVGAEAVDERVVRDRRITAGGVTSGIDFALVVLAALRGDTTAKSVQLKMQYDPAPPFHSGHPRSAEPAAVADYRQETAANYQKRAGLIRSALTRRASL